MIYLHEKKAVQAALYYYMQAIASGRVSDDLGLNSIIRNIYDRSLSEHLPVGAFSFDDYKSHVKEIGYDLTDEQVNDFMEESRRMFDATIGISWDVIAIHFHEWTTYNKIDLKPVDKAEEV